MEPLLTDTPEETQLGVLKLRHIVSDNSLLMYSFGWSIMYFGVGILELMAVQIRLQALILQVTRGFDALFQHKKALVHGSP